MRSRCRRFPSSWLLACLLSWAGPGLVAQAPAAAAVDAALAAWEQAAHGSEPQRGSALAALAAFDDARATGVLLGELERAGVGPFAVRVVQLLGQRPRGDAIEPLRKVLERRDAPVPLQRAAAVAIGRQGNRGVDLLLDLAREDGDPAARRLRDACCEGLAAAGDERAWRGLAALALQGSAAEQQHVLHLLEPVREIAAVTQARTRLLHHGDPLVAAMAWRQLAVSGYERAAQAFDDLQAQVTGSTSPAVRAELITGLAAVMAPDFYEPFLALAADASAAARAALRKVAADLGRNAAFVHWLVAEVLERPGPAEREAALQVLRKAPPAALAPLLERVRKDVRAAKVGSLDLAIGLHDLLARDPTWKDDLLALARSKDAEVRAAGLALLLELGDGDALAIAQQSVEHKSWQLRSIAYRYLTRFRDLSSIPVLIARADKEQGRLDAELGEALFAHTGTRRWGRAAWEAWWRKNKDGHALPAAETVHNAARGGGGATVAYFGIPLASRHAAFLIDVSGSMGEKVGTDRQRSRLDEAKRQLHLVIDKLPQDHEFNVIAYESGVQPAWDGLRKARPANKQEVLALIDALQPHGGTNIHDALELAFRDRAVDTIYLLTDGQPSAGRITDVQELADAVQRWNYARQIVVHCIAVGVESALLRRLAQESGGQYVQVR